MKDVVYKNLGVISYKEAWDLQEKLLKEAVHKKLHSKGAVTNYLLFCRHPMFIPWENMETPRIFY